MNMQNSFHNCYSRPYALKKLNPLVDLKADVGDYSMLAATRGISLSPNIFEQFMKRKTI